MKRKTALITGSSRGIGKSIKESLSKDDFQKSVQELNNFEFEMNDLEQQFLESLQAVAPT